MVSEGFPARVGLIRSRGVLGDSEGFLREGWVLLGKRGSKTVTSGFGGKSEDFPSEFRGFPRDFRVGIGFYRARGAQNGHFWFLRTSERISMGSEGFPREDWVLPGKRGSKTVTSGFGGKSEDFPSEFRGVASDFRARTGFYRVRGVKKRSLPVLAGNLRTSRANFEGFQSEGWVFLVTRRSLGVTSGCVTGCVMFGSRGVNTVHVSY